MTGDERVPLSERFTIDGWQDHLLIGVLVFVGLALLYTLLSNRKK